VRQAVEVIDVKHEGPATPFRTKTAALAHVRAPRFLKRTSYMLDSQRRLLWCAEHEPLEEGFPG